LIIKKSKDDRINNGYGWGFIENGLGFELGLGF
jgi:hypothetical protein